MVDREIIRRHMQSLEEAVRVLVRHRSTSAATMRKEVELRFAIERALHLAIQNLLDIGNHLLTALGHNQIEDYSAIITGLAEIGVIPGSFSRRIIKMPGLRNILVHEYVRVNPAKLRIVLKEHLDDFSQFAKYVEQWLAIRPSTR